MPSRSSWLKSKRKSGNRAQPLPPLRWRNEPMSVVAPASAQSAIGSRWGEIENFRLQYYALLPEPPSSKSKSNRFLEVQENANRSFSQEATGSVLDHLHSRRIQLLKDLASSKTIQIATCHEFKMKLTENF